MLSARAIGQNSAGLSRSSKKNELLNNGAIRHESGPDYHTHAVSQRERERRVRVLETRLPSPNLPLPHSAPIARSCAGELLDHYAGEERSARILGGKVLRIA